MLRMPRRPAKITQVTRAAACIRLAKKTKLYEHAVEKSFFLKKIQRKSNFEKKNFFALSPKSPDAK